MLNYEITARELSARLGNPSTRGDLQLIDVREPWEYTLAHVEGFTLIPMGDIPTRAHAELDPDRAVVVICHAGVRSMNVTLWLREQGFEQAQSVRGGIDAWSREIDPGVPRY